jgi:hypothetical protein
MSEQIGNIGILFGDARQAQLDGFAAAFDRHHHVHATDGGYGADKTHTGTRERRDDGLAASKGDQKKIRAMRCRNFT